MMRKVTTFMMICLALSVSAQTQYNLFDPADVDADGWIWFDTQEKIDKYISQSDNEHEKIDPNGKIIQLICASHGDFEDSTIDPAFMGVGTDKALGGVNAKTGSAILAKASGAMSTNGGGIAIRMPSCVSISLFLSSEASMLVRLHGSTDEKESLKDYKIISAAYATTFKPLSPAGQFTWKGMETLDNGAEPFFKLASSTPIIARLENLRQYPLYVHGMKVITSTKPTGIHSERVESSISFDGKNLTIPTPGQIQVYSTVGQLVASKYASSMDLSHLSKGIYVVKTNVGSTQETTKIAIR